MSGEPQSPRVPLALNFEDAVTALGRGGVLLLPTDTLPGLHCRADQPDAVQRVADLKGRDDLKALLVLAGSLEQAWGVCGPLTAQQKDLAAACWPGPFSLILPAGVNLAARVTGGLGTVAVRVPEPLELRELILAVGRPLVSTSVNRQGETPATTLKQAVEGFIGVVDGFWCDSPLLSPDGQGVRPSALVDLTCWPPKVLRKGPKDLPEQGLA